VFWSAAGASASCKFKNQPAFLLIAPEIAFPSCRSHAGSVYSRKIPLKFDKERFSMAIERTFSMIKPDATKRNLTGAITAKLEEAGLRVVASKRVRMSLAQAEAFYAVHSERPFFGELTEFMSSGPTVVQVLEGENAIAKNREVMGATNPAEADEGTIRKEFALSLGENSVHGSDAPETAAEEIAFWFAGCEIVG
jgi:nucleoside-diphosphate kinase